MVNRIWNENGEDVVANAVGQEEDPAAHQIGVAVAVLPGDHLRHPRVVSFSGSDIYCNGPEG